MHAVTAVHLRVAQWPPGPTVHQIWVAGPDGELQLVHEISEVTGHGQILRFWPESPLENVQFVRVVTLETPGVPAWVEIEVYGE